MICYECHNLRDNIEHIERVSVLKLRGDECRNRFGEMIMITSIDEH